MAISPTTPTKPPAIKSSSIRSGSPARIYMPTESATTIAAVPISGCFKTRAPYISAITIVLLPG